VGLHRSITNSGGGTDDFIYLPAAAPSPLLFLRWQIIFDNKMVSLM